MKPLHEAYEAMANRYPPLREDQEATLARRAAGGDLEAKIKLFRHNAARIRMFMHRVVGSSRHSSLGANDGLYHYADIIAADDAVCIIAASLWKAISTFNPDYFSERAGKTVRFSSWANLIIRRDLHSAAKRERGQLRRAGDYEDMKRRRIAHAKPETAETQIARERLWELVYQLPPDEIDAVVEGNDPVLAAAAGQRLRAMAQPGELEAIAKLLT